MRYSCRWCDFVFEGILADSHAIFTHDKTHPENDLDAITARKVAETPELLKKHCSHCGCREDHDYEYSEQEKARVIGHAFKEDEQGNVV
jgi:hypothetical protein